MIRSVTALVRAAFLTNLTYRVQLAISLVGLVVSVVPVFYISRALQPVMADAIKSEGHQYFAFILLGTFVVGLVGASVGSLPEAVRNGISSGFLEALLGTRASLASILVGLSMYSMIWAMLRGVIMLAAGTVLGARISWAAVAPAFLVLILLVAVHWMIGLIGAAMVLSFRTAGPLSTVVMVASSLLGGAYYPTSTLPGWLKGASVIFPTTYGLRALRRIMIDGQTLVDVVPDLGILLAQTVVVGAIGVLTFRAALRQSQQAGTLSHY
jgi:ABC-2 type transport system permease protein